MLRHLISLISWPVRAARHRADLALLASLDDRGLADIGLYRGDLRDATALPLAADPTSMLSERAKEREASALRARTLPHAA